MLRQACLLLVAGALVGCESSGTTESTQRAAFAAQLRYPQNIKPATDLAVTALVNRDSGTIELLNASAKPVNDVNIWVNSTYVVHVDSIPASGITTVRRSQFFDSGGNSLGTQDAIINKVELEMAHQLYTVQGPVFTG